VGHVGYTWRRFLVDVSSAIGVHVPQKLVYVGQSGEIGVDRIMRSEEQGTWEVRVDEWNSDLMTVGETARVLNVPVSWVYERTRRRGKERIPHIKLGKYLRFEVAAVRTWLAGLRSY
jgi:excisionase family DNA binding protein